MNGKNGINRKLLRPLALMSLAGLFATGCYHHHNARVAVAEPVAVAPTGNVVVRTEPPPLRREVVGVAPSAEHVWVQGYWVYRNGRYVWMPGRWELRPRSNAVWVPGNWDHTVSGWVWRPGHWE